MIIKDKWELIIYDSQNFVKKKEKKNTTYPISEHGWRRNEPINPVSDLCVYFHMET